jgi:hypothetical protein
LQAIRNSGALSKYSEEEMNRFCEDYTAAEMAAVVSKPAAAEVSKGGASLISGSVVERLKTGTAVTATESAEDRPRVLTNTKLRKKMVGVPNR